MEIGLRDVSIIVLSGKARAGKDSTASYMKDYYESKDMKTIILQYSTSIKEYAKIITGWDGLDESKPREFLQFLGTSIIRERIDDEFFIKRMIQDINLYSYFYDVIIISDARLVKEIKMLKDNFDKVVSINVVRPNFNDELSSKEKMHITETGLDNYNSFDYVICNDKGLDELNEVACELVSNIIKL